VRIVLDTSVLITAESLRLVLLKKLTILMDYKLSCEYRDVAFRAEHLSVYGKTQEETTLLLDMLEALAEPVLVVFRHTPLSQDANDDMVLEVAINGGADAIVTNNAKHFREPAKRFNLKILTPAELLNESRKRR
jgi:predicted nucleic acid-binding protein